MATSKPFTDYTWTSQGPFVGKPCPLPAWDKNRTTSKPCVNVARWALTFLGDDPANAQICCGHHMQPTVSQMIADNQRPVIIQEIPRVQRRSRYRG